MPVFLSWDSSLRYLQMWAGVALFLFHPEPQSWYTNLPEVTWSRAVILWENIFLLVKKKKKCKYLYHVLIFNKLYYILVSLYQNITYFIKYTTKRNFETMRRYIFSHSNKLSCLHPGHVFLRLTFSEPVVRTLLYFVPKYQLVGNTATMSGGWNSPQLPTG